MSNPVFQLQDVSYYYLNKIPAVREVSFEVEPGERIAILGANGSGKSTLMHLLDGLFPPSSGKLLAFGQELTERRLEDPEFNRFFRERVGFLFQNPDVQLFCPVVWEEVAFGPLQLDLPREEILRRVEDVLEMLGIRELRDRPPYALSGGEKKKVALGSILSINPQVLILDEPTNGLDPRTQQWLIELLAELHLAGKTLITATHDLSIVEEIADRALVMDEGHSVVAEGSASSILNNFDLLLEVNLIHEHVHRHGEIAHHHGHGHFFTHDHPHERERGEGEKG
ncbi:MAG: ABC transporter ATP-binding protein [bacterium]